MNALNVLPPPLCSREVLGERDWDNVQLHAQFSIWVLIKSNYLPTKHFPGSINHHRCLPPGEAFIHLHPSCTEYIFDIIALAASTRLSSSFAFAHSKKSCRFKTFKVLKRSLYNTHPAHTRPSLAKEFQSVTKCTPLESSTQKQWLPELELPLILAFQSEQWRLLWGGRWQEENEILHWLERWKAKSTSVKETKQLSVQSSWNKIFLEY